LNHNVEVTTPTLISGFLVKDISTGYSHSLFLTVEGLIYGTGRNDLGQLGDGTRTTRSIFAPVAVNIPNIVKISSGAYFSIFLTQEGKIFGFGQNNVKTNFCLTV
jgi:alpha-tubulin suppressor-like RCC1 family protein